MKKKKKVRKHVDPYRAAQAKQRRTANVARQEQLRQQRVAGLGNPIRSTPTPFTESLRPRAPADQLKESFLNYYIKPEEMDNSIEKSKWLSEPFTKTGDSFQDEEAREQHQMKHDNAVKAMQSITSLDQGNNSDKTRVHIMRCIEEFGRHNTDKILPPKAASSQIMNPIHTDGFENVPKRSGPDTGSSEVQVAILTAKITVLADNLHNKDKNNKRSLRLLVHKRQKLLNYLRRKERGGPRWQNLVEKLGINDAMWKGEITL
jgi:ribosomal protein S15